MGLPAGARFGPYEITELLGAGGMGEVYRARDARLDRDVALKVVRPEFVSDPERLSRFEQEARAAARLEHPNILVVHDIGAREGSPYIVSELLEGASLREMLVEPLPQGRAVEIALQIARGLSAAHEKGIVHRDLKPENVFVTKDGRVKILDFGLAKLTQPAAGGVLDSLATTVAATEPGVVLGTVGYMSPEQVLGKPLDARSDLFSLGVVLYEMLSGRRPFQRATAPEILTAILREEPPDLVERNKNVPPALERIVRRCLEKEPDRRLRSARDVASELESLGGLSEAKPAEPMSAAGVFLRRYRAALSIAALLAIVAGGAALWWKTQPAPLAALQRMAVLPFENLSGDPEQGYLAEGIHEALITDLARLGSLRRVIARASAMRYLKTTKPISQVARELGVDAIITGSVLRSGNRVRVTAHLINPASEEHLWSESFEREMRDVLSLQNEIVAAITRKASLHLTGEEKARLASARPVNPEAHEAYLKGRFHLNKFTPEGFEKGISYLKQAIERDPSNPLPYAGLALGYSLIGHEAMPDAFEKAKVAALKAQQLGGSLAETEEAIAEIKLYSDWDWPGAEQAFRRALALNPSLPDAHAHYSWYLMLMGRREEALSELKRAAEADPLTPVWSAWLSWQYLWVGRTDEAIAAAKKSLELNPAFPWALSNLGAAYARKGMFDEAIATELKAAAASPKVKWNLGYVYALAGRKEDARKVAAELEAAPTPMNTWGLAEIYAALGDKDAAFKWLEAGFEARFSWMPWIEEDIVFEPLRSDPRFQDLKRRIGVPGA